MTPGAVWLITGAQGSGKSTIADLLARHFDPGVHVRGGQFYRWAVRGWIHAGDARQDEARRLLDLRYRLAAKVADEYAAEGFTCVVQDNIYGLDVPAWFAQLRAETRHLVVLRPSVDVVIQRDDHRRLTTGKVAYRDGFTPTINDAHLAATPRDLGLWLDTSTQQPEETLAEILARRDEAIVP